MKKFLIQAVFFIFGTASLYAQSKPVTIKAGTIVPMQAVNTVLARDVEEGQTVDFKVTKDVQVDGLCAIPAGTLVKGKVIEASKSTIAGTKGKLAINISGLTLESGEQVYFSNCDVRVSGKNRTPLSVVTALFIWPCIFIPGTKAVMPSGYEIQGTVASSVSVTL